MARKGSLRVDFDNDGKSAPIRATATARNYLQQNQASVERRAAPMRG
jgi:hypothetical protein